MTIRELIVEQASRDSSALALLAPGRKPLTYAHLLDRIDYAIHEFGTAGIGVRDRVAVVLPNGPDMAVAFLAVAAIGACAPLNAAYLYDELDRYLADLKPKALIVGTGMDTPAPVVA